MGIKQCVLYLERKTITLVLIKTKKISRVNSQCSEICGILHSSMPIVVESVSLEKFLS